MQIHSVAFAISRQINRQNNAKTNNLLCAGNKVFVKNQAQGFFLIQYPTCVRPWH